MVKSLSVLLLVAVLVPAIHAEDDDIETLLAAMSLEHKVGQMFMVRLYGGGLTEAGRDLLQTWQPGAAVLLATDDMPPEQITRLTNSYQEAITTAGGPPLLIAVDQEGGIIARLKHGFTTWPVPMLVTAADDPDLAYRVGERMAAELRAVGINMNLAPVADLRTNLDNPIIGRRSPGSDPHLVGRGLAGVVRGMQSAGVLATLKHFPGHGDTSEDSHVVMPAVEHSRDRLEAVELPPFIAGIEAGAAAVMTAHIWFPAFDPALPLPASLSHNVVTGLLREELSFDGLVVTDALDMDAIDTVYSPERAAVMAVQAGTDLVLIGAHIGETVQARAMQAVVEAVRAEEIDEARIDDSVRRILQTKRRFDLLAWEPLEPETAQARIDTDASLALIEALFRAGVTVAYDHHDRLPLPATGQVAVIYPGNRSLVWHECSRYSDNLRWYAVSDSPTDEEITTAAVLASQVEVIVVFTRDAYHNRRQQDLVNVLPGDKTVVVALVSPFDRLRFPQIGAYVMTYSPLNPGIEAACAILFGALPAVGTIPVWLGDDLSDGAYTDYNSDGR
jgi:beta-N-acetylhexosaminidase